MKLACSSLMLSEKTLTAKAVKLKRLGYEGISVFVDYSVWNEELHEELSTLEERTGIRPCEFVFCDPIYGHLMDEESEIRNKARTMYKEAATISAELGVVTEFEYACLPQNPLPLYHPYEKMSGKKEEMFISMFKEIAAPLLGSMAFMLLENLNRYESPYLNSLEDCCDLVRKADIYNSGVLCDFFHMSIEESDIVKAVKNAGDLIKHVHIGDTNRLIPGRGRLNWQEAFSALKHIGYKGFCTLECALGRNEDSDLAEAATFIKRMI